MILGVTSIPRKTASHPVLDYNYDALGRLVKITPQQGGATEFTYNSLGQITQITDPLGKKTTFVYNVLGQNTTVTDRNGEITTFTYTPHSKVDTISYHGGSQTQYTYDSRDNITKMVDTLGETIYIYDSANRLTQHTDPNGFIVKYQYDQNGNISQLTYPGNKVVTYQYDALNRLSGFVNWLNQTTRYEYDAAGRMIKAQNGNGTESISTYDLANRLLTLTNQKANGEVVNQQYFMLDLNGNRVSETKIQPQMPTEQAKTINYSYNTQKNRLTQVNDGSVRTVTYDLEGQTQTKGSVSYLFNARYQVINLNGDTFEYDGAGNRLKATRGGIVTYYIYDAASNLFAEANASKQITRYYVHGAGLSQMIESNQSYTYHFDAIGNTMAMTDQSQNVVNQYAYSPYGRSLGKSEQKSQPFTYVGQYGVQAEQNNHYYMRARYYDADTGRFISEDPIGFDGGINLFAYASSNPILYSDPTGLWTFGFSLNFSGGAGLGGTTGVNFVWDTQGGFEIQQTHGGGSYIGNNLAWSANLEITTAPSVESLHGYGLQVGGSIGGNAFIEGGIMQGYGTGDNSYQGIYLGSGVGLVPGASGSVFTTYTSQK